MADEPNPPPAAPPPPTPDAVVLRAADEAVSQAKAAQAAFQASGAELVALKERLAKAEAEIAARAVPPPVAPDKLDAIDRFMARERNESLLRTVRDMGWDAPLSEAQALALIPAVDPREPDGIAKLEAFRQANPKLFKTPGQTPESVIEAIRPELDAAAKKSGLFSAEKLLASVYRSTK